MENIYIGDSRNGKGVIANADFIKGQYITKFDGDVLTHSEVKNMFPQTNDRFLQIGPELYLGPSENNALDFINHACEPNAGAQIIGNEANLIAIQDIQKGEEITFDYSTTMDENNWELLNCNYGMLNCRGRIRDFKHLPENIKERYAQLGVVPEYNLKYVEKLISLKS